MRKTRLFAIGLALSGVHAGASAQLLDQRAEGTKRVCIYRASPVGKQVLERRVGIGEACPAFYPTATESRAAPLTARLVSNSVINGDRVCAYQQRDRRWRIRVPVETQCKMTAGMLNEERSRQLNE